MFLYKIKQWGDKKLKNLDASQTEGNPVPQKQRSLSSQKGRRASLFRLKPLTHRDGNPKSDSKPKSKMGVQYSMDVNL
jgi:hypothetical protein